MNARQETSGKLTVGLTVLALMAMALIASEARSPADDGTAAQPDRILILDAGKG